MLSVVSFDYSTLGKFRTGKPKLYHVSEVSSGPSMLDQVRSG